MTGERIANAHPQTAVYAGRFIPMRSHLGRDSYPATIELFDLGGVPSIRGIEVRIVFGERNFSDIIAHSFDASSPVSLAHESYAVSRASSLRDGIGDCASQARYRIRPFIGGVRIDPQSATHLPENFLFDELDARLVHGPVLWRLLAQYDGCATVEVGTIALDARVRNNVSTALVAMR
ncbi:MAG TPA: hypothetical protein VE591_07830 [Candidatus Acidoferrum sp.]|nr:hypothetical protein [Candidatus Acidoferrum sp.]